MSSDLDYLSPPEAIIEEARQGHPVVLLDDEDRENEGDIVIPAQCADADLINFMATHARGLVCLALTEDRVQELGLPLMHRRNTSDTSCAFTVSIEAREGITTGISAHDRARTVATAIDPSKGARDIVTPGHIFPVVARDGGVLVRAGHTEAAVDIARLAGFYPAGVICEVMRPDGTMARLPDLVAFAQLHGLKVGTIEKLIAYRARHDHMVERTASRVVEFGGVPFVLHTYNDTANGENHVALTLGGWTSEDGRPSKTPMIRVQAVDLFADVLGIAENSSAASPRLHAVAAEIARHGCGAIVLLCHQPVLSEPHAEHTLREYGIGAQILADLDVHDMILLSDHERHIAGLHGFRLNIVEQRPLPMSRLTEKA